MPDYNTTDYVATEYVTTHDDTQPSFIYLNISDFTHDVRPTTNSNTITNSNTTTDSDSNNITIGVELLAGEFLGTSTSWILCVNIDNTTYYIYEPYKYSYEEWTTLLLGEHTLYMVQNGIYIDTFHNQFRITLFNDQLDITTTVPLELISPKLKVVLDTAKNRGLWPNKNDCPDR